MNKNVKHIDNNIRIAVLTIISLLSFSLSLNAQAEKKYIRQGNRDYENKKYPESEILYRKALDKNKEASDAIFNIGDALYKQNKFEEAGKQFQENINLTGDKKKKAEGFYNLGNSLLRSDKIKESIEAYKRSLIMDPENKEAKYNLAYAQDMLKKQEQDQQKQQNDKNKEKDNKKDDQSKDKTANNDKQQNDQNKNSQDQNEKNDQKQQQQQQSISKEDAERLLNALANDEKSVQEKVKREEASKANERTVKNW